MAANLLGRQEEELSLPHFPAFTWAAFLTTVPEGSSSCRGALAQGWKESSVVGSRLDSRTAVSGFISAFLFLLRQWAFPQSLCDVIIASLLNGATSSLFNISHQKLAKVRTEYVFKKKNRTCISIPKHKVKWSFYLSSPSRNGNVPKIFELKRIWEITSFNGRELSPRGVGGLIHASRVDNWKTGDIPRAPSLLPSYALFPPVLHTALPITSHFVLDCIFFFPFYYQGPHFFHPCPSIITHLYIHYISRLQCLQNLFLVV